MFTQFLETQRALATVLIFIATFFVALSIGRLLKRRAGVRLGVLFQLFCLTLAFYAGITFYGVRGGWRNHVGAAVALLSTAFVVALINRYLWDAYYEKRRQTVIPHFVREVVALAIFVTALLLVLSLGYHAEAELKGLLAGSGIAAIILALAAQNLLGGIIAGVSLQISRPYKVSDWLQVNERFAEVMEINWRSTRLRTNDGIYLDIPNNEIVRQTIINLHYPTANHAMRLRVGVDYATPPNRVKDALIRATAGAEGVVPDPKPKIYVVDFADSAVLYEIKFWMGNHAFYNDICDAIRTNIWYEFKRDRITIPFPVRTLHLQRRPSQSAEAETSEVRALVRGEPLFSCLDEKQIDTVLAASQVNHYGRGERVVEEGAEGDSMFILLRGAAQVAVTKDGVPIRVGGLRPGDCFGEMSLLTGERRTATIRAEGDCEVLEISKAAMGQVLRESPECLNHLSALLAKRRMETEGILKEAQGPRANGGTEHEYHASFARRLRAVFEL